MVTRREFLKLAGLTVAVVLTPTGIKVVHARDTKGFRINAWINISTDNTATIFINKSEMGQGVYTGLTSLIADEMDFPLDKVRVKFAQPRKEYIDPRMGVLLTGGSTSTIHMFTPLRKAGAIARILLLKAGAQKLNVRESECKTEYGKVIHIKTGKYVNYGEIAEIASKLPIPKRIKLKKEKDWIYIGKPVKRLDSKDKINGEAKFGVDIYIDDFVYATVIKPEKWGSRLRSYSIKKPIPKEIERVFPISNGIAICGSDIEKVWEMEKRVKAIWSKSKIDGMSDKDFIERCKRELSEKGYIAKNKGNAEKVLKSAKKKIKSVYTLPYLYHATAEPMNCTVRLSKDRCDIWLPTQAQTSTLRTVKRLTGLPEEKIFVHTTFLGGGFGRRAAVDFVVDAVEISKKVKKPVKLIYSRETDVRAAYFRPVHVCQIEGSVDEEGNISAWKHKIAAPSLLEFARGKKYRVDPEVVRGVRDLPYDIENLRVEYIKVNFPVPIWYWRSVASSHNAFTVESFMDELAHLAGKDPVDFRLNHLFSNPRAYKVVEIAAEKSGWDKPKYGQAMGIGYHYSFRSHVAQVVEVSVNEKEKSVNIHRVVCVIDLGPITVNPELVKMQMESAIIMGLSSALYEKVTFKNGSIVSDNFDTYQIMRIDKTPEIEVYIHNSRGVMGGVGEPGLPPVIPALTNAIFRATGKRIRNLPVLENL